MNILIFGDSITFGNWDKKGGWVQRLRTKLYTNWNDLKKYEHDAYNLGIDGDTTTGVLERLEEESKRRIWTPENAIMVFAIGINDSVFIQSQNQQMTPLPQFKKNLKYLIEKAREVSKSEKVVFLGLSPVEEEKLNPVPWAPDFFLKNKWVKEYEDVIANVCKENKSDFIPVFGKMSKENYKEMLEDGLHPNEKGHEFLFQLVWEYFSKKV